LIFGSTGRTGKELVKAIVASGRDVVICPKSNDKVDEMMNELQRYSSHLFTKPGVNACIATDFAENLFDGVTQIISCIGPSMKMPEFNSENVDFKANINIIRAVESLEFTSEPEYSFLIQSSFKKSSRSLKDWRALDDVIMGGLSFGIHFYF
jgi:hypothetical protein